MKKPGFGIAETLIASVVLAMLALSFFTLNSSVQRNVAAGNSRAIAATLAQQELEHLRFKVEEAWTQSRSATNMAPPNWDDLLNSDINIGEEVIATNVNGVTYTREYSFETVSGLPKLKQDNSVISDVSSVARRAKVTIRWQEGSRQRSYELFALLTDWRTGLL